MTESKEVFAAGGIQTVDLVRHRSTVSLPIYSRLTSSRSLTIIFLAQILWRAIRTQGQTKHQKRSEPQKTQG